jgi:hypothetical protein
MADMNDTLVFIPADSLIIYNDKRLTSPKFTSTSSSEGTIRALHWSATDKHVEFETSYRELTDKDFNVFVMPYMLLFKEVEEDARKQEVAQQNDPTFCAQQIREKRDYLISQTDFMLMQDYPLSTEDKRNVEVYRQALRDITKDPSFPWTGTPVESIPWPKNPLAK